MIEPNLSAAPRCLHFGTCGGCQYQDLSYPEQLRIKRARLQDLLQQSNIDIPLKISVHSSEPYAYRNRIRLRVERIGGGEDAERISGQLRLGYNIRATTEFLAISMCPIAASILFETAKSLISAAEYNRDVAYWLDATSEVELFCNHDFTRVQVTLFCAPRTKTPSRSQTGSFATAFACLQNNAPQITGAAAIGFDLRSGLTGRTLAEAGSSGLNYRVSISPKHDETYWITRGGFFQVNRFLLETLVRLVTTVENNPRSGVLAWDLYAGVGLFSRVLARTFNRVTAVEANPTAAADLRSSLSKLNLGNTARESTTLDFLRGAALDRDRPDLIVLDPPRAGVGREACELLNRIAAPSMVYVSCDPASLTRDLSTLQPQYRISALHLVDLFPQTTHLETVALLERTQ